MMRDSGGEDASSSAKQVTASASVKNMRLSRTRSLVELRNSKKNEQLMVKRTNSVSISSSQNDNRGKGIGSISPLKSPADHAVQKGSDYLQQLIKKCMSTDITEVSMAVQAMQRHSSMCTSTGTVSSIIGSGFLNVCSQLLEHQTEPTIIYNALWCLINITSAAHEPCEALASSDIIPKVVNYLNYEHLNVIHHALWIITNMAGDSIEYRDMILLIKELPAYLETFLARCKDNQKYVSNIAWFISNIFRYKRPQLPIEVSRPYLLLIPKVIEVLGTFGNLDCLWTLCYASQHSADHIQTLIDLDLHKVLFEALERSNIDILIPVTECLGNFAYSSDIHAQLLVDNNIGSHLTKLLSVKSPHIIKDTLWLIGNLAAGTPKQINHVFKYDLITNYCLSLFDYPLNNVKITFELLSMIYNFLGSTHTLERLQVFATEFVVKRLSRCLALQDVEVLLLSIEILYYLLKKSGKLNAVLQEKIILCLEANQGVSRIENLQNHPSDKIYKSAYNIIIEFLGNDDEQEEEQLDQLAFGFNEDNKVANVANFSF